jgi:SAM-dependent methyltransferase
MGETDAPDVWAIGDAYEPYVGRWSRAVAREFLGWLGAPPGGRWLDVGCGTGALSETILHFASPSELVGIDTSAGFLAYAGARMPDPPARFLLGDARSLPVPLRHFDAVVSGLVLNFVPNPREMALEMVRAARPGGTVGCYVWDYAGGMEMMRAFWDAASALDPAAAALDEGERFGAICHPEALTALFSSTGLREVDARPLDVPTHFRDFDDYWTPFLGGQGPAPAYVATLDPAASAALRGRLRATLPVRDDGSIPLMARAWAVKGIR